MDKLSTAMKGVETVIDDEESTVVSSVKSVVVDLISHAAEGSKHDDLRRGKVLRTSTEVYVWPQWIVQQVRVRLAADHLKRKEIIQAVREAGGMSKQPLMGDSERPRVWAFPLEILEGS